jgi:hypothetical protein
LQNSDEKYKDYFHQKENHTVMTIAGKRKLISSCIHGIDIDAEAVEVARMSLALKIIDDLLDYEDYFHLGVYGYQILNKIGENIEYGNTLVSNDILTLCPDIKKKENIKQHNALNIFNWWKDGFSNIFELKQGFDYVIGNPPYVEAKHMTDDIPIMHDYLKKKYTSAKKGKIDLLIPFVEKGLTLLNKEGRLGVIIQNRFFKNDYGEGIRELITTNKLLSEVITFDLNNIFKDRITYISSLILLLHLILYLDLIHFRLNLLLMLLQNHLVYMLVQLHLVFLLLYMLQPLMLILLICMHQLLHYSLL